MRGARESREWKGYVPRTASVAGVGKFKRLKNDQEGISEFEIMGVMEQF